MTYVVLGIAGGVLTDAIVTTDAAKRNAYAADLTETASRYGDSDYYDLHVLAIDGGVLVGWEDVRPDDDLNERYATWAERYGP
jgi:hypothetical protein